MWNGMSLPEFEQVICTISLQFCMFCIFPIKWNNQLYFAAVSARFKSVSEELTELLRSNFRSATDINPTWTSDHQLSNYQYVCVDKGSPFLKCVGSIYESFSDVGESRVWQAFAPPPLTDNAHNGNNTFQKGASLTLHIRPRLQNPFWSLSEFWNSSEPAKALIFKERISQSSWLDKGQTQCKKWIPDTPQTAMITRVPAVSI